MPKKLIYLISFVLVLIMTAGVANAALVALDDFSSGDETGGIGWGTDWVAQDDGPMTMSFSTADPFYENFSAQYRSAPLDTWDPADPAPAYVKRTLATSLMFGTTPEVWIGVYLRPTELTAGGWQFGFEVGEGFGSFAGMTGGTGAPYEVVVTDGSGGGATGDGTSVFTLDQETLLVLRLYKSGGGGGPQNQKYNTADLYADLDGTDGRYNNEVAIVTGYSLTAFDEISVIQLYSDGFAIDFDYVAIGTTKADVTVSSDPVGTIAPASISVTEDSFDTPSDTYTITITEQPPAGATFAVHLNRDNLRANGLEQVTVSPPNIGDPNSSALDIVFDSANWSPVTVTVTAVDDLIGEPPVNLTLNNSLVLVSGSVDAGTYPNWASPWLTNSGVSVSVEDDDFRYTIEIDELDPSGIEVSEQGPTFDTFTVVIGRPPTNPITIDLATDDGQTSLSPDALVFNSSDWDTPQPVTVTAVDDTLGEDDPHLGYITSSVSLALTGSTLIEDFNDEVGLNVTIDPNSYVSGGYLRGGPGLQDKTTSSLVNDGPYPLGATIEVAFNMLGSTETWGGIEVLVGRDGRTGNVFDGLVITWYPAEGLLDIMEVDEGSHLPGSTHHTQNINLAGYDPSTDYLMTVLDSGTSLDVTVAEVADPDNNFTVTGIDVSGYARPGDNIGVGIYFLAVGDLGGGIDEIAVTALTEEESGWLTAPTLFVGSADGNASIADNDCTPERSATLPCDISGPGDIPDCKCDMYDLAKMAANWVDCSLPNVPGCI